MWKEKNTTKPTLVPKSAKKVLKARMKLLFFHIIFLIYQSFFGMYIAEKKPCSILSGNVMTSSVFQKFKTEKNKINLVITLSNLTFAHLNPTKNKSLQTAKLFNISQFLVLQKPIEIAD